MHIDRALKYSKINQKRSNWLRKISRIQQNCQIFVQINFIKNNQISSDIASKLGINRIMNCLAILQQGMQERRRSRSNSNTSERNQDIPVEPSKRLFVSNLTPETSEGQLRSMFEDLGRLNDFHYKVQETGAILCFIEYGTQEEADSAIAKLNGKRVGAKMIYVKYARPRVKKQGFGNKPFQGQRGDREQGNRRNEGGNRRQGYGQSDRPNQRQSNGYRGGFNNDRSNNQSNNYQREGREGGRRDNQYNDKQENFGRGSEKKVESRDQGAYKKPVNNDLDY